MCLALVLGSPEPAVAFNTQPARKLVASAPSTFDSLGRSVAIDGDRVIAGAIRTSSATLYVYERDGSGTNRWGEIATITPSKADLLSSVELSGDTAIFGAPTAAVGVADAGIVYIYRQNAGGADNWGEVKELTAFDASFNAHHGWSVSIDGDTAAVGSPDAQPAGAVYVYGRDVGGSENWGLAKRVTSSDGASVDLFGRSVSLDGDTLVVGATLDDDGGDASGSAYVFERNAGGVDNWGEVAKITASDAEASDVFGDPVSLSGDTVLVGAEGDGDPNVGAVYVFVRDHGGPDNWGQVKKLLGSNAGPGDRFGVSASVNGDRALVGADLEEDGSGVTYVFERDAGGTDNWGETARLRAPDAADSDAFGSSVGADGRVLVVAAPGDDYEGPSPNSLHLDGRDTGAVYVFDPRPIRMFVTTGAYPADFGGLSGGDAICRTEAGTRPGIWKAFLSIQGTDRFGRLPAGPPAERIDGEHLADDSVDLNGPIDVPLETEPTNGTAPAGTRVWTGDSDADGNCADFSATAGDVGGYGITSESDTDWHSADDDPCTSTHRLYCFRFVCPTTPDTSCDTTWGQGALLVKETKPGKEKIRLDFGKGPELAQEDLGNPLAVGGTSYSTCVYDGANNLVAQMDVDRAGMLCAGKPCWLPLGGLPPDGLGYLYRDKDASSDGIARLTLKAGNAGKSKLSIRGANNFKKDQDRLPTLLAPRLAGSTSVTAQLHDHARTECFSVTYDDVKKDDGRIFKAKK